MQMNKLFARQGKIRLVVWQTNSYIGKNASPFIQLAQSLLRS